MKMVFPRHDLMKTHLAESWHGAGTQPSSCAVMALSCSLLLPSPFPWVRNSAQSGPFPCSFRTVLCSGSRALSFYHVFFHLTPGSWDAEVCRLEISSYCYPPMISDLERAKEKGCTDLTLCKEGIQSPLEQGLLGVTEEPQSPVSQHPSPQAVLRAPLAAPVALVLSQQPRCSAPAKPSPSCPDGEGLLSIQWEKKNSRKPRAEHCREICPAPPPHAGRETRRGKVWGCPGGSGASGLQEMEGPSPAPGSPRGLLTALGMGSAEGCSQGNTLPSTAGTPGGRQPTARTSRPPSSEPR